MVAFVGSALAAGAAPQGPKPAADDVMVLLRREAKLQADSGVLGEPAKRAPGA